jgi:opacity protein-like surface antigen
MGMRTRFSALLAALTLVLMLPSLAGAHGSNEQQPPPRPPQGPPGGPPPGRPPGPPPLRIFLDCWECDTDYLRREITWIDYVREPAVADLHVLVTTRSTGGGGSSWNVKFIGRARFAGIDRMFTFTTSLTATSDDRRKEFARVFKLGLVAYAADTGPASRLDVTWRRPSAEQTAAASEGPDPWNRWLFRTNASASVSGEESSKFGSYRMSFSGSRTTPEWKINLSANRNYSQSDFVLSDTVTIKSITESWSVGGLMVKSLTGKWSWGTRGSVSNSSFSNTSRASGVFSGIEYDFFPYAESDRRSLTIQYTAGATSYRYRELTIFDKLEETVPSHAVNVSLGLRQPWGSVGAFTSFNQHLNHMDRWRLSTSGNADVRVFKGLSVYVYAGYSRIRDQIGLRKGAATPEEILLRLQQQATSYSFNYSFGVSYSFGSIFTSIVNPRFGGGEFFFF